MTETCECLAIDSDADRHLWAGRGDRMLTVFVSRPGGSVPDAGSLEN